MESVKNHGFRIVLALTLTFCFSSATAVFTQDAATPVPPFGLLPDGSFEGTNRVWDKSHAGFCHAEQRERLRIGLPAPYEGAKFFIAGGFCPWTRTSTSNHVTQVVTIPANATNLSLWYFAFKFREINAANEDYAYVSIDNEVVWQLPLQESNNTADWTQAVINVANYAGQTITLTLGVSQDDDVDFGLALFDYLAWLQPEVSIQMTPNKTVINKGTAVDFTVSLTNDGNTSLGELTISNTLATNCNRPSDALSPLAPGEQTSYVCSQLITAVQFVNVISVAGVDAFENHVTASAQSEVTGIGSALAVKINPPIQTILYGGPASFTITVTNGNALALEDIEISIPDVPNCSRTIDGLPAYSSLFYTCTQSQVISNITTTVTVTGRVAGYPDRLQDSMSVRIEVKAPPTEPPAEPPTEPVTYTTYLPLLSNNYVSQNQWGEPNDACPHAFNLSTTGSRQFLAENVDDWYQFELTETSDIVIKVTEFAPIAGQVSVWRGNCNSAVFLGHNGDFSQQKTIMLFDQPPGSYLIWLINDGPMNSENPYTLLLGVQ